MKIAMCWDGVTPTAELQIEDNVLSGDPETVKKIFDNINDLQDRAVVAEASLQRLYYSAWNLWRELDGANRFWRG